MTGAARLYLTAAVFLAAACDGPATASLRLHNATASGPVGGPASSSATGPGAAPAPGAELASVSSAAVGLRLLAIYLTAEGAAPGDTAGGALLWLNPECDGDEGGCDVAGARGGGPRVRGFLDLALGGDAVNLQLAAEARAIAPGAYRSLTLQFCKLPPGQSPLLAGVQWWAPQMAAARSFPTTACSLETQAFQQPLRVAAGDQVEVALAYDLSTAVFSGKPAYNVQCLQAGGENACFSDCADFGGGRTCAGVPALAPSASASR